MNMPCLTRSGLSEKEHFLRSPSISHCPAKVGIPCWNRTTLLVAVRQHFCKPPTALLPTGSKLSPPIRIGVNFLRQFMEKPDASLLQTAACPARPTGCWNLRVKAFQQLLNLDGCQCEMNPRTINSFSFQIALLLLLSFTRTEAADFPTANAKASAGDTLTDAEIRTMLRDYIDSDKLGVGLVVGIVDEHGTRVVSHGKLDNGTDRDVDGDTLFEIGSITKVFTALLLQDMV